MVVIEWNKTTIIGIITASPPTAPPPPLPTDATPLERKSIKKKEDCNQG